ncbi:MAG: pantoate--beta-alanine ligase [Desulfobulbaceae bacterium]|nr:pantoate--beta-alanine ligase [Desulfobulbaceae bacterium]
MEIIHAPREMTLWASRVKATGQTIALVPTMGAFHEGHLQLMRLAATRADRVVVSLFVNPIQFGPNEDFSRYPRDLERDASLAGAEGIDVLFAPAPQDMYPPGFRTKIVVGGLTDTFCGRSRPGHFDGVTTVVGKLFHMVKPELAIFGEKDFQQLAVIRKMVKDLSWDIELIGHPIVREADGLAMSSRNAYLSPAERQAALFLSKAISLGRQRARAGETDASLLIDEIRALLLSQEGVAIDYIAIVDGENLTEQNGITKDSMLLIAAIVGKTRLIDNGLLLTNNDEN